MNPVSGQTQSPIEERHSNRLIALEGVVLLLAAPFLMMPELSVVATAAALLALAAVWLTSLFNRRLLSTPLDAVMLVWCITLGVGMLATADPAETLPKATGLILGLAVWRYVALAAHSRRHVGWAVAAMVTIGLGFSLVGVIGLQEIPKIPILVQLNPFRGQSLPGLAGFTVHPNQLAGLICLFLPVIISLLLAPRAGRSSSWLRLGLGLAALWTIAILILTQSRGGWVGALAGLFILLILWAIVLPPSSYRTVLRAGAVALALVGLGAILWIGPVELRDLWLNPPPETAVGSLVTLNYRKEIWPWAVRAVADFPYTGVGLGAFRQVVFRLYPIPFTPGQDIAHAHNIFLQTALDVGLPGLVAYVALLIVAAVAGWRVARRDVGLRAAALGLLAGLAAVHVFGLADALALGSKPGIVFWLALGVLAAMNREEVLGSRG